jgi:outer membrane protein OmpA-like peptidoglycan-associated protein
VAILLTASACGGSASQRATPTPAPPVVASESPIATESPAALPSSSLATESPTPLVAAETALPSAAPAASAVPSSTAPSSSPSPVPTAQATENPDLFSFARGTFVRSWTVGASTSGAQALVTGSSYALDGKGAAELVLELPAVARIAQIAASASFEKGGSVQLHVAAATGNSHAFTDVGTIALTPQGQSSTATGTLQGPIAARWLRVRVGRSATGRISIQSLTATGDVSVPANKFAGRWGYAESINASDAVFAGAPGRVPAGSAATDTDQIAAMERTGTLIAASCTYSRDVWHGPIQDGAARLDGGGTFNVVDNGNLLVGVTPTGEAVLARRIAHAPGCDLPSSGRGSNVLIVARYPNQLAKYGANDSIPGYHYRTVILPMLTAQDLRTAHVAVLSMSCSATKDTQPDQQKSLLDFVAAGHVLVIRDADSCTQSEYTFVPYPFTTAASGAAGARGSVLSIVDSSALAGSDPTDRAHYFDVAAYLKNTAQQLGDADIMQTTDVHWCGLLFAKNRLGASGWVRAYARYGNGVIVYDGFDVDDLHNKIPPTMVLGRLAYGLSPSTDLPCNAHVASNLVVLSSVQRTLAYGTARDLHLTFTIEREGAKSPEPITLSLAGEHGPGWRASVDRHDLSLGATPQRVNVVVHVPAGATATTHLYTLMATATGGQSAQAAIEIGINEALAKQLEKGGRVIIYGIHFDVASARIQSRSQSVIRQIGAVLQSHSKWRMRVEGYTDSDGGAAYNLALSRRRAQSVVDDLVAHLHIARARLRAAGYGVTHPVASNATDAGKALNRRVELARF